MNKQKSIKKWKSGRGYRHLMECVNCHKYFEITSGYFKQKRGKFCSQKCYGKSKIGQPAPHPFKKGHIPWSKNKKCLQLTGKNNPNWKGDKAGYYAIHSWICNHKGKPQTCIDCNITCKEQRLYWSNIDHKYSRNLDDYVSRCHKCHSKYDKQFGKIGNNQYFKKPLINLVS